MIRLLMIVRDTVQNLSVVFAFYRQFFFLPVELPALVELTVQGPFLSFPTVTSTLPPTLQRLHVVHVPIDICEPSFAAIVAAAPGLTHLRIVPQGSLGKAFIECVGYALGLEPLSKDSRLVRFPTSLRMVLFQPTIDQQTRSFEGPEFSLVKEMQRFVDNTQRLVLLKPYDVSHWGHESRRMEWLDRINGGSGCWTV